MITISLNKYAHLTMEERIDRIGLLLARAVRLLAGKDGWVKETPGESVVEKSTQKDTRTSV